MLANVQGGVIDIISYGAFLLQLWALIDSLRYRAETFISAGKQTKAVWTGMLGAAVTIGFLGLPVPVGIPLAYPLSLPGLAAIVVAGIYLAGVRPALQEHQPPGPSPQSRRDSTGGW